MMMFFFSSRRRHTRCSLVTGVQTCALPIYEHRHLLVHAGVLAKWDIQKTLGLAAEVEEALRGPDWKKMLHSMYGNEPVHWKDEFSGSKRIRVIINAFTRMRMCNSHGHMEFSHKGATTHDADGLMP